MLTNDALREEEATFEQEDNEHPVPPTDVVAYNELRSCADLFRMYVSKNLEIQPDFQRETVWKQEDKWRFIDSLVKQLPIPSMCFSLDHKKQKWKVIDGLQRMESIIKFLSNDEWRLGDLKDIHPGLRNVTNLILRYGTEDQRKLYTMVQDMSIPLTVIRCDYLKKDHMNYLFTIFHRLNSGGVRLNNQEIRNCIYSGAFNDMLKVFDRENVDWKVLIRRIRGSMNRFRSVELALRVLAFSDRRGNYEGNLARFLNDYMQDQRVQPDAVIVAFRKRLSLIAKWARQIVSDQPRTKLSLLVVEALLVALDVHRDQLCLVSDEVLAQRYAAMQKEPIFMNPASNAVMRADNVRNRLDAAIKAFSV